MNPLIEQHIFQNLSLIWILNAIKYIESGSVYYRS